MNVPLCDEKVFGLTKLQEYTCQLFLTLRREIFIMGVRGFSKTTRSYPTISEDVRRFRKTFRIIQNPGCELVNTTSSPVSFLQKSEISGKVSSFARFTWTDGQAVIAHIFSLGVRNWREIEVYNPQA